MQPGHCLQGGYPFLQRLLGLAGRQAFENQLVALKQQVDIAPDFRLQNHVGLARFLFHSVQPFFDAVQPLFNAVQPLFDAVQPLIDAVQPFVDPLTPHSTFSSIRRFPALVRLLPPKSLFVKITFIVS